MAENLEKLLETGMGGVIRAWLGVGLGILIAADDQVQSIMGILEA